MIFGIITVAAVLVFLIAFSCCLSNVGGEDFGAGMILGMFIIILAVAEIIMIRVVADDPEPKAIDVYRGKTELEIHSINNMPQDTVVVWKNIGGVK